MWSWQSLERAWQAAPATTMSLVWQETSCRCECSSWALNDAYVCLQNHATLMLLAAELQPTASGTSASPTHGPAAHVKWNPASRLALLKHISATPVLQGGSGS